jgi:Rrf2 family transcriptional regulator, iron-sulfur cluster assembly transcription factor
MSVIFSRQCEYALQAIMYISMKENDAYTDIKEISKELSIPPHFLAKIMQNLSRNEILRSYKGPTGGFALAMDPKEITLYQLVVAIDGDGFLNDCVLGLPVCGGENPCPVHEQWGKMREEIHEMLAGKTIAQLVKETKKKQDRKEGLSVS